MVLFWGSCFSLFLFAFFFFFSFFFSFLVHVPPLTSSIPAQDLVSMRLERLVLHSQVGIASYVVPDAPLQLCPVGWEAGGCHGLLPPVANPSFQIKSERDAEAFAHAV